MPRHFVIPCAILLAALPGCLEKKSVRKEAPAPVKEEPQEISTKASQPDVLAEAVATARDEIDLFIAALKNPKPYQLYFSVKKPFPYESGGETRYEDLWISKLRFEDGVFKGNIRDEPIDADVNAGDEVAIPKTDVSDWMIVENDLLVGGYTIRALRDQMNDSDRARFDASFPFTIE